MGDGRVEGQNYGDREIWRDGILERQNAEYYVPFLCFKKAEDNKVH